MNCIIHRSAFVLNRKSQQTNILLFFWFVTEARSFESDRNRCSSKKTSSCSWWCMFGPDVTTLGYWRVHLSPGSALNCYTSARISFSRVRLLQGRTRVDRGQQQLTHPFRRITTYPLQSHCTECTGLLWPLKKVRCTAHWVSAGLRTDLVITAEW